MALDGTKIKADASKHKAMSYERIEQRAAGLEAEVANGLRWLKRVVDKKRCAERIRQAKTKIWMSVVSPAHVAGGRPAAAGSEPAQPS